MQRLLTLILGLSSLVFPALAGSVLVFPFFNVSSPAANLDWIGVSISQTIEEALASQGLLVIDREDRQEVYRRLSIRPYARLTRASVIKVAEALDAGQAIYGEFEFTAAEPQAAGQPQLPGEAPAATRSRGSLRLSAYVIDVTRMRKGPQFSELGPLEDLARLQTHLAWQVLRFLSPGTSPSDEEFMRERPPVRVDAMENYVRGLLAATADQKHRFFTQAARLDENFSQPCYELGKLNWAKKEYRTAGDWLARVKPTDPRYLEANFLLGLCRYYLADYVRAQAAFEMVSRSVPLNEIFNDLGAVQSRRNLPGALDSFQKALEGDSADPDYHFNVGYVLWKTGKYEAAAERFRAVLERNPEDAQATLMLGRCLKKSGPRPGDTSSEGLERLKLNYEERAYRELKAALEVKKKN